MIGVGAWVLAAALLYGASTRQARSAMGGRPDLLSRVSGTADRALSRVAGARSVATGLPTAVGAWSRSHRGQPRVVCDRFTRSRAVRHARIVDRTDGGNGALRLRLEPPPPRRFSAGVPRVHDSAPRSRVRPRDRCHAACGVPHRGGSAASGRRPGAARRQHPHAVGHHPRSQRRVQRDSIAHGAAERRRSRRLLLRGARLAARIARVCRASDRHRAQRRPDRGHGPGGLASSVRRLPAARSTRPSGGSCSSWRSAWSWRCRGPSARTAARAAHARLETV